MVSWTKAEEGMSDSNDNEFETEPGKYDVEVAFANEKRTSKGDLMWSVKFINARNGKQVCWDNLVFSPKGKGIAFKKLSILMGVSESNDGRRECENASDLVGQKLIIHTLKNDYRPDSEDLKVEGYSDPDDGIFMGYQSIEGNEKPESDLPF